MSSPLSTDRMRNEYATARCETSRMTRVVFHGWGSGLLVERRTAAAWRAFSAVMAAHNYRFRQSSGGTYNCRPIGTSGKWSLHAYGLAVDLNPSRNPHGTRITDMPAAFRRDVEAIRTKSGRQVFKWGGDWGGSSSDPMHWQIGATPHELSGGLNAPVPTPSSSEGFPMALVKRGDDNEAVETWQALMARTLRGDPRAPKPDGDYGPKTAAAVKAIAGGDGNQIDPETAERLIAYHAKAVGELLLERSGMVTRADLRKLKITF